MDEIETGIAVSCKDRFAQGAMDNIARTIIHVVRSINREGQRSDRYETLRFRCSFPQDHQIG
jgi:hypothetical protein